MNKIRLAAVLLSAVLLIGLFSACAGGNAKFEVIKRLEKQELCAAFRKGDVSGQVVIAALAELQDAGTVDELALKWFGDDVSLLEGDPDALEEVNDLWAENEGRSYIVGYEKGRLPISGEDNMGMPTGFDAELAQAFCELLDWKIKFVAIDPADAVVELNSGNVDCVMGGYVYDADEAEIDQSPVYIENTVVLVTLKGSGIRSMNGMSGKTLTLGNTGYYKSIKENYPELGDKPKFINTIAGGMYECLKALEGGTADAIVVDLVSLEYYK